MPVEEERGVALPGKAQFEERRSLGEAPEAMTDRRRVHVERRAQGTQRPLLAWLIHRGTPSSSYLRAVPHGGCVLNVALKGTFPKNAIIHP
ncbi:hypothetical protein GCM10017600_72340 [Streptosporangium carneum]|uniref:Uncharacterized protein n=1 Tax=Streptosporangium carneum TaxID=47481 RepID=A0A9W6I9U8_9ACTN|nr:hypothetical protein GCM10017600_72340 [Streptosporangium carneum]